MIFLLLFCSFAVADEIDPPDIHTQTLQQYLQASEDPLAETKIRQSYYLDSLMSELQRLAEEIDVSLSNAPELKELFKETHESFLESTNLEATLAEAIQWYNFSTGEFDYGSDTGELYILISAEMVWERILLYKQLMESIELLDTVEFTDQPDITAIGGE